MKTRTVNNVRLAYVDRGTGPPLLLVHGFPLDHSMWDAQIDALAADYRVIAPDLRGFGQSGPREGASDDTSDDTVTMARFADDLAELLDALGVGEPIVLCGLSMGGYIALEFRHRHAARLRGLVLCDTRASADSPQVAAGRSAMIDQVQREGAAPAAEQMLPKLFAPSTAQQRPELIELARGVIQGTDPRAIVAAVRGMSQRRDMTADLGRIACPTLVIVGQRDAISPPDEMRAMAAAIPGTRFVEIADAGHMTPMERPAEVTAAIRDWLRGIA